MRTLLTSIAFIFILLPILADIIAGIWLAILGEWMKIIVGVIAILVGPIIIGILKIIGAIIFGLPANKLALEKNIYCLPLLLLNNIYIFLLSSLWSLGAFYFFIFDANSNVFWPLLLWSYGVALGPWMYLAQGDDSELWEITKTAFYTQLAYISMCVSLIYFDINIISSVIIFLAIMISGILSLTYDASKYFLR